MSIADFLFYLLPVLLLIAVIVIRKDTKHIIMRGDQIQKSLNDYINKERKI